MTITGWLIAALAIVICLALVAIIVAGSNREVE